MTPFFWQTQNKIRKNEEDLDFQDILLNVERKCKGIHISCFYIIKGNKIYTCLLIFAKNTGKMKAENRLVPYGG